MNWPPKNSNSRSKEWVVLCRREDLMSKDGDYLYKNCKMCAEHFEDMMFANDLRNRLTPEAKPTLFSVPNPPPTVGTKRRVIEKVPAEAPHSQGKTLNIFLKIKYVTGFVRLNKKMCYI